MSHLVTQTLPQATLQAVWQHQAAVVVAVVQEVERELAVMPCLLMSMTSWLLRRVQGSDGH